MARMLKRNCLNCKGQFECRAADAKRGWGLFCSKSCKAVRQEKRTGQYANYMSRKNYVEEEDLSWDAHKV